MGQDTYFELIKTDGTGTRGLWSKGQLAILWLACFRISDIVLDAESGGIGDIQCDIETARSQFEKGLAVLRKTFPDTDFDITENVLPASGSRKVPGIAEFRQMLFETEATHAELKTYMLFQDFSAIDIDRLLVHALLGFSQPACKIFYDRSDDRGSYGSVVTGVMTWGDAIRALTMQCLQPREKIHPADSPIVPLTCLFTEEEYMMNRWPLAGV